MLLIRFRLFIVSFSLFLNPLFLKFGCKINTFSANKQINRNFFTQQSLKMSEKRSMAGGGDYNARICSACSLVFTCLPTNICSIMPSSLIIKVVRMVPTVFFPYITFSPQAPIVSNNS